MSGIFEHFALEAREERTASRKAVALAHTRVMERFGAFITNGDSREERLARISLVEDSIEQAVREACEEQGHEDADTVLASVRQHLSDFPFEKDEDEDDEEDDDKRESSVHESRKPRLCPYHNEVVDISLAQGEPQSGYNAMAQHAWGGQHCQGREYEGPRCSFKREMTTQTYWDQKAQEADERRQQRELEQQQQIVEPAVDTGPTLEETPEPTEMTDGGDPFMDTEQAVEPEMAIAAFALVQAKVGHWNVREGDFLASLTKEAPGDKHLPRATDKRNRQYEHIKDSYESEGTDEDEAKELAARTVNKQRAEHGETKKSEALDPTGGRDWDEIGKSLAMEKAVCPRCGSFNNGYNHGFAPGTTCSNCGTDISTPPVRTSEALKTVDVEQGGEGPSPKMDKSKWDDLPEVDAEMSGTRHPTEQQDISDTPDWDNQDRSVGNDLESEDVTKGSEGTPVPAPVKDNSQWTQTNGVDPVTSASLTDPEVNPITGLIEGEYDGFIPASEVQDAIEAYE